MIISEIFKSIQGEGKYSGHPVLFIRTSGCNRNCDFCDTKYHIKGKKMSVAQITKEIKKSKCNIVVWTGGEPMLQQDEIYEVIQECGFGIYNIEEYIYHHLETNGDILPLYADLFSYIAFSPKHKRAQQNVIAFSERLDESTKCDIKIVTDLKMNKDMISDATMLMPLTTNDKEKDKKIQQDVWNYCVKNNKKYCQRIHIDVWGNEKGV